MGLLTVTISEKDGSRPIILRLKLLTFFIAFAIYSILNTKKGMEFMKMAQLGYNVMLSQKRMEESIKAMVDAAAETNCDGDCGNCSQFDDDPFNEYPSNGKTNTNLH